MGGCYKAGVAPGSEICTAASEGKCTACNAGASGKYVIQNGDPGAAPGTECILCSDAAGANGYKGVANCGTCALEDSSTTTTCKTCQARAFLTGGQCTVCGVDCLVCTSATECGTCTAGKYLKTDSKTCVDAAGCSPGTYADPAAGQCKACSTIDANCGTCEYNEAAGKGRCLTCTGGGKTLVKAEVDGTTTCVTADECATNDVDGSHFRADGDTKCILCSDTSGSANDQGVVGCKTCTKNSGSPPTCSECLDGYYDSGNGAVTCTACTGESCAAWAKATKDQCSTCKPGYFLKTSGTPGQCFACDDANNQGVEGCAQCSGGATPTCTKCKLNYRQSGSNHVTCTKTCEDDSACGGTAGACGAIVVGGDGKMKYYCSHCGESTKFPIDGICTDQSQGNTGCVNNVCTFCTTGYFLYMGGCYSTASAPGSLMCKTAAGGICTTPTGQYFKVPGASNQNQSVLRCGSSSGTTTGTGSDAKAYVGVEGCKTCTAPSEAPSGAMAPARCTACGSSKKPSLLGSGCFTCTVDGCSHCSADGVCEACTSAEQRPSTDGKQCIPCNISGCTRCSEASKCSQCGDGYRLESDTCVPTGPNLSSGAIAGISVAAVVVVGGLVGFLCWWFVCRGKA
ncbi:Variant-specific surface protein [Giardia duodenalis]|uniref:Variant-specific surface protein n=1 Tax=Giardia intestinalis TaxID=5741 RepID=V6TP97_GIAIN|nr:Variant-specific surface protein [Giardia intestinalis]